MRSGGGFSFYQASERRRQGIIMKNSNNIKVIRKGDKAFPEFLSDMEDGPESLYCIGDTSLLKEMQRVRQADSLKNRKPAG